MSSEEELRAARGTQITLNNEQANAIADLSATKVKETDSIKVVNMNKADAQEHIKRQIEKWNIKNGGMK
ncbi:hypothetical protein [Brochothrix thermosphacta]|uniref:Uncharacterized protein n=1 Tax=Brochothrix thermosphacta TaxID=2756 RepID=A0A2X0SAF4_BROTH|nr:hypothetical protein [Brochothrix thermosphacta]SPP28861.1 hypothetical protein BTBSAS_30179 [Brochothrix thermosphacta]